MRLKQGTVQELVSAYAQAASSYGRALQSAKFKEANRQADRIAAIYQELGNRGGESRLLLLPFLNHIDVGVRLWAGAHALELAPELAQPVLARIAKGRGLAAAIAGTTLGDWRSGDLHF